MPKIKEEEKKEKKVAVFCASEQKETQHVLDIDGNGEILLTCSGCERFLKLPSSTTAESLKAFIESHKASNEGQITKASLDAKKEELMASLDEITDEESS